MFLCFSDRCVLSVSYICHIVLQGEDGSTYDAVFCFRYDRLAGGT